MNELIERLKEMQIDLNKAIKYVEGIQRIKHALDDQDLSDGAVCDIACATIEEIENET